MRKTVSVALALVLALGIALGGCSQPAAEEDAEPAEQPAETEKLETDKQDVPEQDDITPETNEETSQEDDMNLPNPLVTIEMENGDKILVELMPKYAPNTVNNFVKLAQDGFYDGVIFHRVVPGFVIQGGDPDGTGMGGPGYSIKGEFLNNGVENRMAHKRGVISMARSQDPDSAGSQFFIVTDDAASTSLDRGYAAFGIVVEGMDAVDTIEGQSTKPGSEEPAEPQVMKSVTVDTKGVEEWPEPETIS